MVIVNLTLLPSNQVYDKARQIQSIKFVQYLE